MGRGRRVIVACLALSIWIASAASAASAQASSGAKPWYQDGLEKLGFTVFPKPEPLPDFQARRLDGSLAKLGDFKGKVLILNFWATWCPPCRAEMPALESLWSKTKDKPFAIMGVSVGEKAQTVKDFIAKAGYGYPIFVDEDGSLGSRFGARSIPTTYLIDKSGQAIAGKVGGAAYDGPEALALFAQLAER